MTYRPQPIIELTTLRELAECGYQALIPADRMAVDLFCQRVRRVMLEKSGSDTVNLQYQSLREFALAVWLVCTFDGGGENGRVNMTKTIAAALEGRRRKTAPTRAELDSILFAQLAE